MDQFNEFCDTSFWNSNVTWHTNNPRLTKCFLSTILIWIPCGFLWVFAPIETILLLRSKSRNIPWTALNISKIILAVCLLFICAIELCHNAILESYYSQPPTTATYYALFIQMFSLMLAIILIYQGRLRGVQSSGILFFFWFLYAFCSLFIYIDHLMEAFDQAPKNMDSFSFGLNMIFYPLVLAEFLLTWKADAKPQQNEYKLIPEKKMNPEVSASFPSKLVYWWFNSVIHKGFKQPLTEKDLWALHPENQCEFVVPQFEGYWLKNKIIRKSKTATFAVQVDTALISPEPSESNIQYPGIIKTFIHVFGPSFVGGSILKLIYDVLHFVSPQILKLLIAFVKEDQHLWKGIFLSLFLLFCQTLQSLTLSTYFYRIYLSATRFKTSLISTIYKKALTMSNSSRKKATVGEIVNLMSVDVQKIADVMPFINLVWSAPLQIIIAVYFIYLELGVAVFSGLGIMIILIPINGYIGVKTKRLQNNQMTLKDSRVKLMNEILNGMKVLKFFAWENFFLERIFSIRKKEISKLREMNYYHSVTVFFWTCAPFLVSLASFATFVLMDSNNVLDAQRAFVSLTLFHILKFPLTMLPMLITLMIQASVSVARINRFFNNDDLDDYISQDKPESNNHPIAIHQGSFRWDKSDPLVLKDIELSIPPGSLVAIVGPVGSGKSSLLAAILGELEKVEGQVHVKGSIAYAAQLAWIQNETVRNNILFYEPYLQEKYKKILKACSLETDLEILTGGDLTEIGEKGINLSGGQKQRVSLARAVYHDSEIYLLDDPLSAVDSHVGKHIFDEVIGPNGLLKKKTRLLVTHGITFLSQTDFIVVMNNGSIAEVGSYRELLDKKGAFADFLLQYISENEPEAIEASDIDLLQDIVQKVGSADLTRQLSRQLSLADQPSGIEKIQQIQLLTRQLSKTSSRSESEDGKVSPEKKMKESLTRLNKTIDEEEEESGTKLMTIETAQTGKVKRKVYFDYFRAMSYQLVLPITFFFVALQAFSVASSYWLSAWADDSDVMGRNTTQVRDERLIVYGLLGAGQGLSILVATLLMAIAAMRASKVLHRDMLTNILHCAMSFFETTPLGRIVNRFAKDIDTVDTMIPQNFRSWSLCMLQVVSTLIIITHQAPYFLIAMIPLLALYYFIQIYYVTTSRQLKRIESITRSPIYSYFSETLSGVSTIRAYKSQGRFTTENNKLIDNNMTCYLPSIIANRWLEVRLEFCGNMIIFFANLFVVLNKASMTPGSVGLTISYALSITATLNWMVRMSSELEANIVAVERIKEYIQLPIEAAWEIEDNKPKDSWPENGSIVFNKYSTRYREGLDLVIKDISSELQGNERVGIVGRTGAGKSSLTLALFRIIEAAEGFIKIDGEDISKLGLHDLRSKLTIIPQDPILFSGTLRSNLDPFNKFTDDELWRAIENSHLKDFVSGLASGLEHEVAEGGGNLSVGQCQLVCLARALLKKTKILILDEATAAVDLDTDNLIQQTIRTKFADCTILTIAHRLNTIMDYNKIMVLDKGMLVEFDSPEELLKNPESIFHKMAKDANLI